MNLILELLHVLVLVLVLLLIFQLDISVAYCCVYCYMRLRGIELRRVRRIRLQRRCQLKLGLIKFLLLRRELYLLQVRLRLKQRNDGAGLIGRGRSNGARCRR